MLYSENPDWKDVTPIPQDDGPNPLVPIAYSTEYILERNPAHYTVWNYRQDVLFALNKDLNEELDYIDEIAADQAKNYQIWHHRQVIADRLNKGDRELDFINSILEDDPKNYHGWSYRQWVVKRFNLWEKELSYTSDLIMFDIRNNSAWNYRYYILFERPTKPTEEEIKQEIEIYEATKTPLDTIEPFLEELVNSCIESPYILSMYIDIYEKRAKDSKAQVDQAALDMCDILASKLDTIREKYWAYRKQKLMTIHV
ncbi:protein prenylyltransferase [Rhizopus microsporus]|uniref:Protein farnesyltransferase/geranylgeranyltransferase type-1 subunit alpha n=1 Tax=Rhizopus microsporus TaxID=58291 RepID=A0A1X0RMG0_RHIZD|nr:protein prenylyltransferase [Rhizopus microsporus]